MKLNNGLEIPQIGVGTHGIKKMKEYISKK